MAKAVSDLSTIKDIHFYYSYVDEPRLTLKAKKAGIVEDKDDPFANSEWVVKVAMPEKMFKAMKKKWKGCTNFKSAKEYDLEEFNTTFHMREDDNGKLQQDSEMPDFGEGVEDIVMIKFAQKSRTEAGKLNVAPRIIGIKGKVQDHNGVTINEKTQIGNGSKGHLQIREVDFGADNGIYLYPNCVCITELVVWEKSDSAQVAIIDDDSFGIEELTEEELKGIDIDEDAELEDDEDSMFA